jgi:hypothetical protein
MGKVAAIGRDGRLMVNAQHASYSATQYARGYISEGVVVTDGLKLYLDAADYASFPGERSLAGAWTDYASHQADYDVVGDDGVILLGTSTNWQGNFVSTVASTGNHTAMFDYWSDNDNTAFSIDNDGINDNEYNTTLDADKTKKTFSKTVSVTATGTSTMFIRPHATGSKVYISNYRFFENGTTWNDLVGGIELTKEGSPTWSSNTNAKGYFSVGAGDRYIQETTSIGITLTTQVTLCAWYRKTGSGGTSNQRIVEVWGGSFPSSGHVLNVNSGSGDTEMWLNDNGNDTNNRFITTTTDDTFDDDVWHYIVGTYSSPALNLYMDGSLNKTGSVVVTTALDDINSICVGAYAADDTNYHMDGDIAAVQIYDRALSAAEVKQNFNAERNRFGI